jgi:hypothetical protein
MARIVSRSRESSALDVFAACSLCYCHIRAGTYPPNRVSSMFHFFSCSGAIDLPVSRVKAGLIVYVRGLPRIGCLHPLFRPPDWRLSAVLVYKLPSPCYWCKERRSLQAQGVGLGFVERLPAGEAAVYAEGMCATYTGAVCLLREDRNAVL